MQRCLNIFSWFLDFDVYNIVFVYLEMLTYGLPPYSKRNIKLGWRSFVVFTFEVDLKHAPPRTRNAPFPKMRLKGTSIGGGETPV